MGTIREELASQFRSLSVALTISMSVVFSIFAGAITGYYLDAWLFDGQSHWLTIICLFFGIAGAAKNFFILTKRFSEKPKEKEGKDQPEAHISGRQDNV
jgi:F0F1-type ATP synthase assembly protein I